MNNQKTFTPFDIAVLLACSKEDDAKLRELNDSSFENFKQSKMNLLGFIDARYRLTEKGKVLMNDSPNKCQDCTKQDEKDRIIGAFIRHREDQIKEYTKFFNEIDISQKTMQDERMTKFLNNLREIMLDPFSQES